MATQVSLRSLFDSQREALEQSIIGLQLPKDAQKIQEVVSKYLTQVFDSEGEFRQALTQSEDYILQAAISLLTAQQEMSSVITSKIAETLSSGSKTLDGKNCVYAENAPTMRKKLSDMEATSLLGAAGGAIAGKLLLNGWGAVFGAIAGVAISVYLSGKKSPQPHQGAPTKNVVFTQKLQSTDVPVDVHAFIEIISKVCDSVDNLISTFRAQVNRVVQKYESQEKPTLDKEYRPLLENLQTLIGYERTHSEAEEKYTKKLIERIEDIVEQLDSYGLEVIDYSEEVSNMFEKVTSPNTSSLKMVYPAIAKSGTAILLGKVFIPD